MSLHEVTPSSHGVDHDWDAAAKYHRALDLDYDDLGADEVNETFAVQLQSLEEGPGGLMIRRVAVGDESELPAASEADLLERKEIHNQLEAWDRKLQEQPDARPPFFDKENQTVVAHNGASKLLFEHDASIREWGLLMPSARALYYLTHLDDPELPSGQLASNHMRNFMVEMVDAVGIRTRKRIAADRVRTIIDETPSSDDVRCLSLACGAADLMLETVAETGRPTKLTLVDIDTDALAMASTIADEQQLHEGLDYFLLQRNLITTMARGDDLVHEVGEESQQIVDALGINEYFSLPIARDFLKNAYRCVKPGGSLITANMLDDRPQMQINKVAVGWPKVIPRSTDDIVAMLEAAELPLDETVITIPKDGVYAVIEIKKPVGV